MEIAVTEAYRYAAEQFPGAYIALGNGAQTDYDKLLLTWNCRIEMPAQVKCDSCGAIEQRRTIMSVVCIRSWPELKALIDEAAEKERARG